MVFHKIYRKNCRIIDSSWLTRMPLEKNYAYYDIFFRIQIDCVLLAHDKVSNARKMF